MSKSLLLDTFDAIIGELPRLATRAMQEERAAVVAWLREDDAKDSSAEEHAVWIEHGAHRREGDD